MGGHGRRIIIGRRADDYGRRLRMIAWFVIRPERRWNVISSLVTAPSDDRACQTQNVAHHQHRQLVAMQIFRRDPRYVFRVTFRSPSGSFPGNRADSRKLIRHFFLQDLSGESKRKTKEFRIESLARLISSSSMGRFARSAISSSRAEWIRSWSCSWCLP